MQKAGFNPTEISEAGFNKVEKYNNINDLLMKSSTGKTSLLSNSKNPEKVVSAHEHSVTGVQTEQGKNLAEDENYIHGETDSEYWHDAIDKVIEQGEQNSTSSFSSKI